MWQVEGGKGVPTTPPGEFRPRRCLYEMVKCLHYITQVNTGSYTTGRDIFRKV